MLEKAQGCLAGLCVGDAMGSQFEFMHPSSIAKMKQNVLGEMNGSKIFKTPAGQITDDGEMALCLTTSLIKKRGYSQNHVKQLYVDWYDSHPIDMGRTVGAALAYDYTDEQSESNGALMRVAPLGIAYPPYSVLIKHAMEDARITHMNQKVLDSNAIYVLAISLAIRWEYSTADLIQWLYQNAYDFNLNVDLLEDSVTIPDDCYTKMGHIDIAFRNAFYHLRNETEFKTAIIETIKLGGDTDTNAAICGALLGANQGIQSIPVEWLDTVLTCIPKRPKIYHANNILETAEMLLTLK